MCGSAMHPPHWRNYILPHKKSLMFWKHTQNIASSSLYLNFFPYLQLSMLETPIFVRTRDPKFLPKWKSQVFLWSGNPKFPNFNTIPHIDAQPSALISTQNCMQPIFLLLWKDVSSPNLYTILKLTLLYFDDHTLLHCYCCLNCCNLNQNLKNV